jgi:hypothetical protein
MAFLSAAWEPAHQPGCPVILNQSAARVFVRPEVSEAIVNTYDRLHNLLNIYHQEARKCLRGRAYLAATVMHVAAFETTLQMMCLLYPAEVKRTTVYARKRFRGKRNRALEFSLHQLINIAEELGWFPPKRFTWGSKRSTVGGFAHEIRKVRNYVHPGEWARGRSEPLKFSKGLYGVVDEVTDVANSWLLGRLEKTNSRVKVPAERKG